MDLFGDNKKAGRDQRNFLARMLVLALLGACATAVLAARIAYLTVWEGGELYEYSENNYLRMEIIPPRRGAITDRYKNVLATSEARYNIRVNPFKIQEEELRRTLDEVRQLRPEAKVPPFEEILQPRSGAKNRLLAANLTLALATPLLERQAMLPGLIIEPVFLRVYPFGRQAAMLTGFVGSIQPWELERRLASGNSRNDIVGRMGLERAYDYLLAGDKGKGMVFRDAKERLVTPQVVVEDAVKGGDLELTLDIDLQCYIHDLLEATTGTVVAMDPRNGEILAMVSSPNFDANRPELASAKGNSSYNTAIRGGYPPGSTFKPITAAAWLTEHRGRVDRAVHCDKYYYLGNKPMKCLGYHGDIGLKRALEVSCNVYFYTLANEISYSHFIEAIELFGFGEPSGIALRAPEDKGKLGLNSPVARPYLADRIMLGIGQGRLLSVTPLQMAVAYSAIANGGTRHGARLVRRGGSPDPDRPFFDATEPVVQNKIPWTETQRMAIVSGLRAVTESSRGTGRHAQFDPAMRVAGKTGSAETGSGKTGKTHAWFVCFAPWDAPEICLVVLLEKAGHGGEEAAPVAKKILEEFYRLKEQRKPKRPSVSG